MNVGYNDEEESGFECLNSLKNNWEDRKNIIIGLIEEIEYKSDNIVDLMVNFTHGFALQLTDLRTAIVKLTTEMLLKMISIYGKETQPFFEKFVNEIKFIEAVSSANKILSDMSHSVVIKCLQNKLIDLKDISKLKDLKHNKNKLVRAKLAEYYYELIKANPDNINKYKKELESDLNIFSKDADQNARYFGKQGLFLLENENNKSKQNEINSPIIKNNIGRNSFKPVSSIDHNKQKVSRFSSIKNNVSSNVLENSKIASTIADKSKLSLTVNDNKRNPIKKNNTIISNGTGYDFNKKTSKIEVLINSDVFLLES